MKLLFIDDEEETRRGIEKNVNWKKLDIHHIVSFSNPFSALDYLEKEPVDIVLSDIRIPQMDGISLCRQILQKNPAISIIFISGYSDKEYLMNAIQMSAVDYIEKPVSIPKLENAIERAVSRQQHTHFLKQQQETAVEIIQKNRQMFLDQLIARLIRHPLQLSEKDSELFPLNDSSYYRIYLFSARQNTLHFPHLVQFLADAMTESGLVPSLIYSFKEESLCVFLTCFPTRWECDSQRIDNLLLTLFRRERMTESISCAYGQLVQGMQHIPESFRLAAATLQDVFFHGYGTILSGTHTTGAETGQTLQMPPLSRLKESLRSQDQQSCQDYLEEVFSFFLNQTDILPDQVRNEYFQILTAISQAASDSSAESFLSDGPADYLWQRISTLHTLAECHQYALEKAEQFFHNLTDMLSERKIILDVIRIIQSQYQDSRLFINSIAEQVYLTPNYLSMLFKQETGRTIGTYLTEFRLQQSACLLVQTNKKLYEIAQAVGYTDTNYYSRLFKKHYHMTPSEYRNHLAGQIKG